MTETARQIGLKEYFARVGSGFTDADARVIGPEIERLAVQGKSVPRHIVEAASDPKSPLHNYFEWQDDVAAQKFREHQARLMVASVVVRVVDNSGEEKSIRAFHSAKIVSIDAAEAKRGPKQHPYVTIDAVRENKEMADSVIHEALRQLVLWKAKYSTYRSIFREFKQFDSVFDAIGTLEEQTSV